MKEQMNNHKTDNDSRGSSRRNMLKLGMLAGGAALIGVGGKMANLFGNPSEPSGEKVKTLTIDGKLVELDKSQMKDLPGKMTEMSVRKGVPGKRYVQVIDLSRCANERACVESCQKMHSVLPPVEYLKVKKMQDSKLTKPYWFPTHCYHCDNPPCIKVCPVDATFKRTDGIVAVDSDRCVGCKFCMAACPYSARTFNFGNPEQVAFAEKNNIENGEAVCGCSKSNKVGTVAKCDFCTDDLAMGKLPACVTDCPNGVIFVGDEIEDTVTNGEETYQLSEMLASRSAYRQFESLGTAPRVYYLPPYQRTFPFADATEKINTKE